MRLNYLFYTISFLPLILLSNNGLNAKAIIIENNPFYGLSNAKIKSIQSLTNDNLINVKLEYAPESTQFGSPEFFKATLFYKNTNQRVLHADTDIIVSKDGKELYKGSDEFSQPYGHTPNGIVLSSYKFPSAGQYVVSVKITGINYMPVNPKQVDFATNVTDSDNKYIIEMAK
jgi:hypothetical protein